MSLVLHTKSKIRDPVVPLSANATVFRSAQILSAAVSRLTAMMALLVGMPQAGGSPLLRGV